MSESLKSKSGCSAEAGGDRFSDGLVGEGADGVARDWAWPNGSGVAVDKVCPVACSTKNAIANSSAAVKRRCRWSVISFEAGDVKPDVVRMTWFRALEA